MQASRVELYFQTLSSLTSTRREMLFELHKFVVCTFCFSAQGRQTALGFQLCLPKAPKEMKKRRRPSVLLWCPTRDVPGSQILDETLWRNFVEKHEIVDFLMVEHGDGAQSRMHSNQHWSTCFPSHGSIQLNDNQD